MSIILQSASQIPPPIQPLKTQVFVYGRLTIRLYSQVGALLDEAIPQSNRVEWDNLPMAREPAELARSSRKHEIFKFKVWAKFLEKSAGGFSAGDMTLGEAFPRVHWQTASRSLSDYVARMGLKSMSILSDVATQNNGVFSDWVYLDGSRVCRTGREVVFIQSCGYLMMGFHQKLSDDIGSVAPTQAADAVHHRFVESAGDRKRQRRSRPSHIFHFDIIYHTLPSEN
jgi:hypothetical protein